MFREVLRGRRPDGGAEGSAPDKRFGKAVSVAVILASVTMVALGVTAIVWALSPRPQDPGQVVPAAQAEPVATAPSVDGDEAMADWDVERAREACQKVVDAQAAGAVAHKADIEALLASADASDLKVAWGSPEGHEGGVTVDFAVGASDGGLVPCVFYARRDATAEAHAVVTAVYDVSMEGFSDAGLTWSKTVDATMVEGGGRPGYERFEGLGEPDSHDAYAEIEAEKAAPDGLNLAGAARAAAKEEAGFYDRLGLTETAEEGGQ